MSTKVTLNFESADRSDTSEVSVPDELLTAAAVRNAMPAWDRLGAIVRDQPDATAKLLRDYSEGRTDLALLSARSLGLIPARTTLASEPEAEGVGLVILLIVVAIILILLFPGTAR